MKQKPNKWQGQAKKGKRQQNKIIEQTLEGTPEDARRLFVPKRRISSRSCSLRSRSSRRRNQAITPRSPPTAINRPALISNRTPSPRAQVLPQPPPRSPPTVINHSAPTSNRNASSVSLLTPHYLLHTTSKSLKRGFTTKYVT